jgi:hypothetical protein
LSSDNVATLIIPSFGVPVIVTFKSAVCVEALSVGGRQGLRVVQRRNAVHGHAAPVDFVEANTCSNVRE